MKKIGVVLFFSVIVLGVCGESWGEPGKCKIQCVEIYGLGTKDYSKAEGKKAMMLMKKGGEQGSTCENYPTGGSWWGGSGRTWDPNHSGSLCGKEMPKIWDTYCSILNVVNKESWTSILIEGSFKNKILNHKCVNGDWLKLSE